MNDEIIGAALGALGAHWEPAGPNARPITILSCEDLGMRLLNRYVLNAIKAFGCR
jgi:hypothetical protein